METRTKVISVEATALRRVRAYIAVAIVMLLATFLFHEAADILVVGAITLLAIQYWLFAPAIQEVLQETTTAYSTAVMETLKKMEDRHTRGGSATSMGDKD